MTSSTAKLNEYNHAEEPARLAAGAAWVDLRYA